MFEKSEPRFSDAAVMFRRAIAVDSTSFVAWETLGALELAQGHWPEATRALEHAERLEPNNLDTMDGLARAHVALGQADAAMPYVNRLGTRDIDVLWSLGDELVEAGRGPAALRYLEAAASTGAPPALRLALLSLAYAESGRINDAVKSAQVATATAADTEGVYALAGRAMIAAHDTSEARVYLTEALALDPSDQLAKRELDAIERARPR
jgi:tetratricopeptide (TPR) repeat protein